jgi:hypothetical protein
MNTNIDFTPFGTDITYEELNKMYEEEIRNRKEPQEKPDCGFGFHMIKNSMSLEAIQNTIIGEIHNITAHYNELLEREESCIQ